MTHQIIYSNSSSFEDLSFTSEEFNIEFGVHCELSAGTKIILKPGFKAKVNSNFRAFISTVPLSEKIISDYDKTIVKNSRSNSISIKVYPNPSSGLIHLSSETIINRIELIDLQGKIIKEIKGINTLKTEINIENTVNGIFILKIFSKDIVYHKRLLLKH